MIESIRKFIKGDLDTEVYRIGQKEKINYGFMIDLSEQLENLIIRVEKLEKKKQMSKTRRSKTVKDELSDKKSIK